MANFVTVIPKLSLDVIEMISMLGFEPNLQVHSPVGGMKKYTIRISKNAMKFIEVVDIQKN